MKHIVNIKTIRGCRTKCGSPWIIPVSNEENSRACMDIKASQKLVLRMPRGSNTIASYGRIVLWGGVFDWLGYHTGNGNRAVHPHACGGVTGACAYLYESWTCADTSVHLFVCCILLRWEYIQKIWWFLVFLLFLSQPCIRIPHKGQPCCRVGWPSVLLKEWRWCLWKIKIVLILRICSLSGFSFWHYLHLFLLSVSKPYIEKPPLNFDRWWGGFFYAVIIGQPTLWAVVPFTCLLYHVSLFFSRCFWQFSQSSI